MTAPVRDPVRSASARRPRPAPAAAAPERPDLRVFKPGPERPRAGSGPERPRAGSGPERPRAGNSAESLSEADRGRLVRQVVVAATLMAALCLFGVVVFHVLLTQNQFRLDKLQQQSLERQAEYDRLRLQVAELESPDRVVAAAQMLGMVTPPKVTYLAPTVEEPGTVNTPTAATDPASLAQSRWSTVKPHLADG